MENELDAGSIEWWFLYIDADLNTVKIGPFSSAEDCEAAEAALAKTKDYHVSGK